MSRARSSASRTTRKRSARSSRTRTARKSSKRASPRKWSAAVTQRSDALDLENKVFKGSPKQVAQSLKRSAERSRRRKSSPYRSAMSMLTFYINRAGRNLPATRRKKLEAAKDELRAMFKKA